MPIEHSPEKSLPDKETETSEVAKRFGDSLTVFGRVEMTREHLEDLEKLPSELINVMREKGLRIVVGEGNIIDLMGEIPGVKALVVRSVEKFLNREQEVETNIGGWQRIERRRQPIPLGVYAGPLKTIFIGEAKEGKSSTVSSSVALHEYGHGLGHLLKLDSDKSLKEAHLRLYPKLIEYLKQGKVGNLTGVRELLAESFAGYFTLSKEQFVSSYDEQLYLFWEKTIATIEDRSEE